MKLLRKPSNDLAWYVIGACVVIYLISAALSIAQAPPAASPIQYLFEPSVDTLIGMGIGGSLPLQQMHLWTLVTSAYLHSNFIHILMNCLCLAAFFPVVSQQFGKPRSFAIYTVAGIAGSLISASSGEIYSLGASGGVLGLYGAMIAYGIRSSNPARWKPVKAELVWAVATFVIGISLAENISHASHAGGLLGGLLAGLLVGPAKEEKTPFLKSGPALGALAITTACLAVGLFDGARTAYMAVHERTAYDALIAQRRWAELNENIRQAPENGTLLTDSGLHKYHNGDIEGSLADFSAAATHDPSAVTFKNKAAALFALGRHEEAIKTYGDALDKDPNDFSARFFRAEAYRSIGNMKAAAEDYREVTTINPADADEYHMRANASYVLGDMDDALANSDKAVEMGKNDAALFISRANIKFIKKDFDGAIADYDRAAAITPQDASIYLARAGCYTIKENYDRAIADYNRSIETGTNNAEAWNGRAWSYFKLGRQQEALADVEKALQITPGYGYALGTRASIFEALGELDKAIADYRASLSKDPDNIVSKAALARLGAK